MQQENNIPTLNHKFRLQWEKAQNSYVLLYAEGMITLNNSAAEILKLCDGQHSVKQIIDVLQQKYSDTSLSDDINNFIEEARKNGWITISA